LLDLLKDQECKKIIKKFTWFAINAVKAVLKIHNAKARKRNQCIETLQIKWPFNPGVPGIINRYNPFPNRRES